MWQPEAGALRKISSDMFVRLSVLRSLLCVCREGGMCAEVDQLQVAWWLIDRILFQYSVHIVSSEG